MIECKTKEDLRKGILSNDGEIISQFYMSFQNDIDKFIDLSGIVFEEIKTFPQGLNEEERAAWVYEFLYYAFNSLVTSFRLLISGYFIPSGHLMRQYGESTAVALLFSHCKINEYEKFIRDQEHYPFHKALNSINKKNYRHLLNINYEAWQRFTEITTFYDKFSHPTLMTSASNRLFSKSGSWIICYEFDSEKSDVYLKEIKRRQSACLILSDTIRVTKNNISLYKNKQ